MESKDRMNFQGQKNHVQDQFKIEVNAQNIFKKDIMPM